MDKIRTVMPQGDPLFLRPRELDRALGLMLLAGRELEVGAARLLPEPLGQPHRLILLILKNRRDVGTQELKESLGLSKQALSRYLQQLVDGGYVEREKIQDDRRRLTLRLTQRGWQLSETVDAVQREQLAEAFKTGGTPVVEALRLVLSQLVKPAQAELMQAEPAHE